MRSRRESGLKELWLTIRKRLWLLIGIAGAMLLLVGSLTFEETPLYSATAELLLKPDIPQALDVRQWQVKNDGTEQHDFYKTEANLAGSPEVAADVIRKHRTSSATRSSLPRRDLGPSSSGRAASCPA